MVFIKKYYFQISLLLLIGLYLGTRLYNILVLPIFTDEAIYIRWSQIALNDASWRFISLTDGKQPMLVWLTLVSLRLVKDPLLAARMVSVVSGLLSSVGIFFLTREIFRNVKIALLSVFLYIIFPFTLVYDRLALYDSLVAMFIIWSLYFEILLVRRLRLDIALILGMIIGGGMLTKTNANFALILLPFSLLLFNFKIKGFRKKLINWAVLAVVVVILSNLIYSILRLSPFFYIIAQKNFLFIYSPKEWLGHPLLYFFGNLKLLLEWFITYATVPFVILILSSFFIKRENLMEKLLISSWFFVPLVSTSLFGKLLYPRFILFMVVPLITLLSYSLFHLLQIIKNYCAKILVFCSLISLALISDYFILNNFGKASIPRSDIQQFYSGWPSGVGVRETVDFIKEQAKNKKVFVGTQGTFGLMPYALEIYLYNNPNIKIAGYWPVKDNPPPDALNAAKKMPVYFVFYQACPSCKAVGTAPVTWPLKIVFQKEKEEKGQFFTLYRLQP